MKQGEQIQLNRDAVTTMLIDRLVRHAYQGSVEDTMRLLNAGPRWPNPSARQIEMHNWFVSAEHNDQEQVRRIVEEVAYSAIFHTLTIFDGVVGTFIPDKITELTIRFQVYDHLDALRSDAPTYAVDINPPNEPTEDLHDLFQEAVRSIKESS